MGIPINPKTIEEILAERHRSGVLTSNPQEPGRTAPSGALTVEEILAARQTEGVLRQSEMAGPFETFASRFINEVGLGFPAATGLIEMREARGFGGKVTGAIGGLAGFLTTPLKVARPIAVGVKATRAAGQIGGVSRLVLGAMRRTPGLARMVEKLGPRAGYTLQRMVTEATLLGTASVASQTGPIMLEEQPVLPAFISGALTGLAFGSVGTIRSPWARIPFMSGVTSVPTYLSTGDVEETIIQAGLGVYFGLHGGLPKGLAREQNLQRGAKELRKNLTFKLMEQNIEEPEAQAKAAEWVDGMLDFIRNRPRSLAAEGKKREAWINSFMQTVEGSTEENMAGLLMGGREPAGLLGGNRFEIDPNRLLADPGAETGFDIPALGVGARTGGVVASREGVGQPPAFGVPPFPETQTGFGEYIRQQIERNEIIPVENPGSARIVGEQLGELGYNQQGVIKEPPLKRTEGASLEEIAEAVAAQQDTELSLKMGALKGRGFEPRAIRMPDNSFQIWVKEPEVPEGGGAEGARRGAEATERAAGGERRGEGPEETAGAEGRSEELYRRLDNLEDRVEQGNEPHGRELLPGIRMQYGGIKGDFKPEEQRQIEHRLSRAEDALNRLKAERRQELDPEGRLEEMVEPEEIARIEGLRDELENELVPDIEREARYLFESVKGKRDALESTPEYLEVISYGGLRPYKNSKGKVSWNNDPWIPPRFRAKNLKSGAPIDEVATAAGHESDAEFMQVLYDINSTIDRVPMNWGHMKDQAVESLAETGDARADALLSLRSLTEPGAVVRRSQLRELAEIEPQLEQTRRLIQEADEAFQLPPLEGEGPIEEEYRGQERDTREAEPAAEEARRGDRTPDTGRAVEPQERAGRDAAQAELEEAGTARLREAGGREEATPEALTPEKARARIMGDPEVARRVVENNLEVYAEAVESEAAIDVAGRLSDAGFRATPIESAKAKGFHGLAFDFGPLKPEIWGWLPDPAKFGKVPEDMLLWAIGRQKEVTAEAAKVYTERGYREEIVPLEGWPEAAKDITEGRIESENVVIFEDFNAEGYPQRRILRRDNREHAQQMLVPGLAGETVAEKAPLEQIDLNPESLSPVELKRVEIARAQRDLAEGLRRLNTAPEGANLKPIRERIDAAQNEMDRLRQEAREAGMTNIPGPEGSVGAARPASRAQHRKARALMRELKMGEPEYTKLKMDVTGKKHVVPKGEPGQEDYRSGMFAEEASRLIDALVARIAERHLEAAGEWADKLENADVEELSRTFGLKEGEVPPIRSGKSIGIFSHFRPAWRKMLELGKDLAVWELIYRPVSRGSLAYVDHKARVVKDLLSKMEPGYIRDRAARKETTELLEIGSESGDNSFQERLLAADLADMEAIAADRGVSVAAVKGAKAIREIYDWVHEFAGSQGLKLGYVFGYSPRLAAAMDHDILKLAFPDGVPKEIYLWAEKERTGELLNRKRDAIELVDLYLDRVFKKIYLEGPVLAAQEHLEILKGKTTLAEALVREEVSKGNALVDEGQLVWVDEAAAENMNRLLFVARQGKRVDAVTKFTQSWIQRLLGYPSQHDHALAATLRGVADRTGMTKVFAKAGVDLENDRFVMDMADFLTRLGYMGGLGLRPLSVLKNLTQNNSSIADIGLSWWLKGIGSAGRKHTLPDGRVVGAFEYLRELGILREFAPEYYKNISMKESTMRRLGDIMLAGFQWADAVNRMGAYFGAKSKIEYFLQQLDQGIINEAQFLKRSGIEGEYAPIQKEIRAHLRRGTAKGRFDAVHTFAEMVTARTQYLYNKEAGPLITRSAAGRMGWQYQTWWANYGEMINDWVQNKQWVKLGRWMVSSLVLFAMLEEVARAGIQGLKPENIVFAGPLPTRRTEYGHIAPPVAPVAQLTLDLALGLPALATDIAAGKEGAMRTWLMNLTRDMQIFIPGHAVFQDISPAIFGERTSFSSEVGKILGGRDER